MDTVKRLVLHHDGNHFNMSEGGVHLFFITMHFQEKRGLEKISKENRLDCRIPCDSCLFKSTLVEYFFNV